MSFDRRDFLKFSGAATLLALWSGPFSRTVRAAETIVPPVAASDPVYHFLNRISYGVRQADLARCNEIGIAAYLDEQLDVENLKGAGKAKVSSLLKADRLKAAKGKD